MSFKTILSDLLGIKARRKNKELLYLVNSLEKELKGVYCIQALLEKELSSTIVEAKRIKHKLYSIEHRLYKINPKTFSNKSHE